MKKVIAMHALLLAAALTIHAQFFLGLRGSSYGGITNVNYNPAIANSPYMIDINLIGVAATVNNNYVGLDRHVIFHPSELGGTDFQSAHLHERINGKNKNAYFGTQIQGPLSFMFSFGKKKNRNKNAIGFSYHLNAVANADNFPEVFARSAYYGMGYEANEVTNFLGKEFYHKNMSAKFAVWGDVGLTYSRMLYQKGDNLIKAGGTLKLLMPVAGAYGYIKNLHYQWTEYDRLSIYNTEVQYAYNEGLLTSKGNPVTNGAQSSSNYLNDALKFKNGTPTAAVDMGVIYEWNPFKNNSTEMDCQCETFNDKKHYKLAAGFSIMDFGALRFKRGEYSENFTTDVRNWYVGKSNYSGGLQSFDDTVHANFAVKPSSKYFTIWLPTRFNAFVDYFITNDFGITAQAMVSPNMAPNRNMVHHVTTFSVTAKYENKWLGVYLPLSYDIYGNISLGTTLRLGPLIIGMQDLLGLFAKKYVYNADVHAALKLTIPYFKICKKGDMRFTKKS